MLNAVITGDFVRSTLLQKEAERKLYKDVAKIASAYPYSVYRGDSFQVYVKNASESLRLVFLLRCAARKIEQPGISFDIRQSIGIAVQTSPVRQLPSAKGSPFILSGRAFDAMKDKGTLLVITTEQEMFNQALELLAAFADDIFESMTPKQALVIFELLSGRTQQEVAKRLKKTQPTINRQAQAAKWHRLQELLNKFDYFIKQIPL